jgi:hypothetical protein
MIAKTIAYLQTDRYKPIYLTALALFAVGLPLSKTAMSIALVLMGVHFLLGRSYLHLPAWRSKQGVALLFFLLIVFIHIAGLLFTTDFAYALKDLRIKLPLLLIPLFLVAAPTLTERQVNGVMMVFITAVLAGSLIALYRQLALQPADPRDLTPFVSHIRFSMMLCLASVSAAYLTVKHKKNILLGGALLVLSIWFIIALIMLESLTGVVSFVLVLFMLLIAGIVASKNRIISYGSITLSILAVVVGMLLIPSLAHEFLPPDPARYTSLESHTKQGNPYYHNLSIPVNENGVPVWIYVCKPELKDAWSVRSEFPFDTLMPGGGKLSDVLIRYLASKNLRKDAQGVAMLTGEEIAAIERGITNYRYDHWSGMRRRFDQLKWEYWTFLEGGSAKGHSLLQRIELWQSGMSLASSNLLTGVGTGDIKQEFKAQLKKEQSPLAMTPLRAHNQFITILITFGIPGLILFLAALGVPLIISKNPFNVVFAAFLVIILFSMLVEDTLETQVGVSFFVFFYSLNIFQPLKTDTVEGKPL